jgi:hypothetical protein
MRRRLPGAVPPPMFSVDEATAAAIRQVFEESGELSAVVEFRRHFPGIKDNEGRPDLREDDCRLEAVPPPAPEANPDMPHQIVDAVMARAIQADAVRTCPLARSSKSIRLVWG